ncbi:AgrD family cyclic lactone autoinducer peptide [Clostridium sp. DJ247]|nr:cyclic lactone autoinducer peptide [Clostridium sp. DJ247]MBC2581413.1 cyclic lactone autoinducer peptide [Clostridium sp. DJ247]
MKKIFKNEKSLLHICCSLLLAMTAIIPNVGCLCFLGEPKPPKSLID